MLTKVTIANNMAFAFGSDSEAGGGGLSNLDQGQAELHQCVVRGNAAIAASAHGGGIDKFVNPLIEHEPRLLGVVTLEQTAVNGNHPTNCEQPGDAIVGCSR